MISGPLLVSMVLYIIVAGLIFWLLTWLINYVNPPEPFKKIATVVVVIVAVVMLINALMTLTGHPLIRW